MSSPQRKYQARGPLTETDVRAFKALLEHSEDLSERALHEFLLAHPRLLGALDFVEFTSEFRLRKRDGEGRVIPDRRRTDRLDLFCARASPLTKPSGESFLSAHLIEIKPARAKLVSRPDGTRLTSNIRSAIDQLADYHRSLTQVPENRAAVHALGWEISAPSRILIAGSELEFRDRPAQLDQVRERLLRNEVVLVTMEDFLRAAERSWAASRALDLNIWAAPSSGPLLAGLVVLDPIPSGQLVGEYAGPRELTDTWISKMGKRRGVKTEWVAGETEGQFRARHNKKVAYRMISDPPD